MKVVKIKKIIISFLMLLLMIPVVFSIGWFRNEIYSESDGNYIVSSDFNSDELPDVFLGKDGANYFYFEQLINTSFSVSSGSYDVNNIWSIDLNRDGYPDVVNCDDDAGLSWFIFNTTSGGFSYRLITSTQCSTVHVRDFNLDGEYDILYGKQVADVVTILINDGQENFTTTFDVAGSVNQPENLRMWDINEDGFTDVVYSPYQASAPLYWAENNKDDATFTIHNISNFAFPIDITIADFNKDGFDDIIYASAQGNSFLRSNGISSWEIIKLNDVAVSAQIAIGDYNNDGYLDFAVDGTKVLLFLYNSSLNNFTISTVTSASAEGIESSDIDNDGRLDLIISESGLNKLAWYQNNIADVTCFYPRIFCDDFFYTEDISTRGWIPLSKSKSSLSISPSEDYELALTSAAYVDVSHITQEFATSYQASLSDLVTTSVYSPVFGSEFKLKIYNTSGYSMLYGAYDNNYLAYMLNATIDSAGHISVYYSSTDTPYTWNILASNIISTSQNIPRTMKIITYFKDRDIFPFNTSVEEDKIDVYIEENYVGNVSGFISSNVNKLDTYKFIKDESSGFYIDNYYIFVGTDKTTPTAYLYYEDFFTNATTITIGSGTGDFATSIETIWDDFGIHSTASKLIIGIMLMFLLALFMFGASMSTRVNIPIGVYIFLEICFSIVLTYLGLIPVWIVIILILGIIAFTILALRVKGE